MPNEPPTGTITFLFTDIEGSTQLWERYPAAMRVALAWHDELLRRAIESHHGRIVKSTGDGCLAAFVAASDALVAALAAQRDLTDRLNRSGDVPETLDIRVRMGLHTGEAELRDGDYYGSAVNRAARIMSIGHGGQVLLSASTASLVADATTAGSSLLDLGEHRLRDLSRPERIFQLVVEELTSDFPPLKSLDAFPGNLPIQLNTFVGRERELAEVKRLLATTRLLTLTGPGGTGKTRLSLQVAADSQAGFTHGVWLVELAPLADPELVAGAVAALFGLRPLPGLSLEHTLVDYLRGKHILIILDNCEHLVDACARLSANLLSACPGLTILATSREGLGIAGETVFHVPTLGLPSSNDTMAAAVCRHDAADLFLQRARAVQPNFNVSNANAAAVAQIVRRLDGIPLAIELAAARIRLLSPEQIAARLDDRFRLLTGGSRTALPRQQTLRALIDWSYDLLDESEQWFFRQLAVFVGGWTLEAAEQVADRSGFGNPAGPDALTLLAGLVNKSLVVVDEGEAITRYRYLETVRQYAGDKLFESGEDEAARDRHVAFFDRALTRVGLIRPEDDVWHTFRFALIFGSKAMDVLMQDVENIYAAVDWALEKAPERGLLMATALAVVPSAMRSSHNAFVHKGLAAVEALPAAEGEAADARRQLRSMAYLALGNHATALGDSTAARVALDEAVRLARESGNRDGLASALLQRSLAAGLLDDDQAFVDGEEAAALYRAMDNLLGVAQAVGQMAQVYFRRGDMARGRPLAEEALANITQSGDALMYPFQFLVLPFLARSMGDIALAEAQYRAGAAEFRRLQNRTFATIMESDLAHMLRQIGRREDARPIYRQAIRTWQDMGARAAVANMLECFAFMARADESPERAAELLGAAEAIRDEIHIDMTPWERREYETEVAALRETLPVEPLVAGWRNGRALTLDEAVDLAVLLRVPPRSSASLSQLQ